MPYDKSKLKDILLQTDCRTLDSNGSILPPSHNVFRLIADRMTLCGSYIDPRHVYTIVKDDRNGFRALVEQAYKINTKEIKDNSDYSFDQTKDDSDSALDTCAYKKFKLVLSAKNWQDMAPKKKNSSGRVYWKFQEGWADIIAERICHQHKTVECVFSFKHNLTTPTATASNYSTFVGYCTECKAQLTGMLEKKPMKEVDVIFLCRLDNVQVDEHTGIKTRQLRGKRREEVATRMVAQKTSAVVVRREMARQLKDFGGKNPPIIPKSDVLRKAKEQQLLKTYGLEFAFGPLNLLRESQFGDHAGFIHSIGLLKFHCIYWTPEQEKIYTARLKKDPGAIMTIDATGSIGKRDHKNEPHVFLYQCMVVTNEGSVPVFQMVTGDQRSLQIANFLRIILAKGVPRPPVVVCDFGRALINAVAEIFGSCSSLADYLERCYAAVMRTGTKMPTAYVRLDVSHVVAMVARWDCLKSTLNAGQQFYQRCISQAYQMDDIKELTYFLESVLVVCLSESVGHTKDGRPVQSEIRMQALDRIIQGANCTALKDDGEPKITDDDNENDYCENANTTSRYWNKWATDICDSARVIVKTCEEGSRPNGCYNPAFALRVEKQLLPFVALWTGIMRPHFGIGSVIATSSSVEAEFGDLKHRSFASKLPMRIDLFVKQHLDHLDGKVKLASNPSDVAIPFPVTLSSTKSDSPILRQPHFSSVETNNEQSVTNHGAMRDVSLVPSTPEHNIVKTSYNDQNVYDLTDLKVNISPTFTEDEVLVLSGSSGESVTQAIRGNSNINSDLTLKISPTFTIDEFLVPSGSSGESVTQAIRGNSNINSDLTLKISPTFTVDEFSPSSPEESLSVDPFTGKYFRSSTPDECNDWNVREDWRGKAARDSPVIREAEETTISSEKLALERKTEPNGCPVRKRRKPTKLDKCPEWKYIKHVKFGKLPVFKNGNFCLPVSLGKNLLNVRNTCAFDAIFHVILSAIASNEDYVEKVKDTTNRTVKLAQNVIQSTRKLTTASYRERADIISRLGLFNVESFTQTVKRLDATCNVAHLAQYLFADAPSHKTQVSCPCGYNFGTQHALLSINVDVLLCEGFNFMQKAIDLGHSDKRICRKCRRTIENEQTYGPHLMIDTAVLTDESYPTRNRNLRHTLQSIAETITVQHQIYRLAGLVHYIPGHYVGYVKSGVYWHEYDDLHHSRASVAPNKDVKPHLVVYTYAGNKH